MYYATNYLYITKHSSFQVASKKNRSSEYKSDRATDSNNSGEQEGTPKQKEGNGQGQRPQEPGKERQVHEEIIARHYEGGMAPTPEAYRRALKQWQQLPGSIVRPPTDVQPPAKKASNPSNATSTSQPTADEQTDRDSQK
jgi:hypothetical protein